VKKLAFAAPKARNVKAWGNAPGGSQQSSRALKARNDGSRLIYAGVLLTDMISRIQRFKISFTSLPGALPQAFTFRALGAANASLLRPQLYETLDFNRESGIEKHRVA
jgi:hypothetical protein